MTKEVKQWLVFTRKERIGFGILVGIVALVFLVPPLLRSKKSVSPIETVKTVENNNKEQETREERDNDERRAYTSFDNNNVSHTLFQFDPNNTSAADWKKLGLRDKTIKTIQNYLSKGGHFYKPADLQKIYGLRKDEFERLEPYIRLDETSSNKYPERKDENNNYTASSYSEEKNPENKKKTISIDINTADTTDWQELPGIGSKRAWSIVNFRDKLGGFYSIEQVGETYNIPDSVFQRIKSMLQLNSGVTRKMNVNTATKDELKMHPYIKWNLANAIVEYRNQHGAFSSIEQLTDIVLITEDIYKKIASYLTI